MSNLVVAEDIVDFNELSNEELAAPRFRRVGRLGLVQGGFGDPSQNPKNASCMGTRIRRKIKVEAIFVRLFVGRSCDVSP